MHAAMEFANEYKEEHKFWHATSNSLVVLTVKGERQLHDLCEKLSRMGLRASKFYEPDIGHELTAVALVPRLEAKKPLSSFPLAGRKVSEALDQARQQTLNAKFAAVDKMIECQQSPSQNILEHGVSVRDSLFGLIRSVKEESIQEECPSWLKVYGARLVKDLYDDFTLEKYALWHDCGKPLVHSCDETGSHFEDHAAISAKLFGELYPELPEVQNLISLDMVPHTLRHNDVAGVGALCRDRKVAATLLLAGLAATLSNADMFGGKDTVSYKIKMKRLSKLGDVVCSNLYE